MRVVVQPVTSNNGSLKTLCGNIFRWHRERRTHLSAEITDEMTSSISQASLKSFVVQAEMPIEAAIADRPTSQSRRDSHPRP
jgi:hypothetical protein